MNEEIENIDDEGAGSKSEGLTDEQVESLNDLRPDIAPESEQDNGIDQHAQMVQMMGLMINGVFAVLAARLGEHWQLKQEESKAIAEPAMLVLDKYFPNMNIGPELALVGAVSMVVLPRAMAQIDIETEKAKQQGVVINGDQSESQPTE